MDRLDKQKSHTKYGGFFMHHKHIKLIAKKQLKEQYPNWKRLRRKKKKAISKKVTAEVIKLYGLENQKREINFHFYCFMQP